MPSIGASGHAAQQTGIPMPTLLHAWSARSGQPDKKRQDRLPRSPADLGRAQVPALTEPVEAQKLEPLFAQQQVQLGLGRKSHETAREDAVIARQILSVDACTTACMEDGPANRNHDSKSVFQLDAARLLDAHFEPSLTIEREKPPPSVLRLRLEPTTARTSSGKVNSKVNSIKRNFHPSIAISIKCQSRHHRASHFSSVYTPAAFSRVASDPLPTSDTLSCDGDEMSSQATLSRPKPRIGFQDSSILESTTRTEGLRRKFCLMQTAVSTQFKSSVDSIKNQISLIGRHATVDHFGPRPSPREEYYLQNLYTYGVEESLIIHKRLALKFDLLHAKQDADQATEDPDIMLLRRSVSDLLPVVRSDWALSGHRDAEYESPMSSARQAPTIAFRTYRRLGVRHSLNQLPTEVAATSRSQA